MKSLKDFDEFLKNGIVKRQFPDKIRARDLVDQSNKIFKSVIEIVDKIGINEVNSNMIIKESYDGIMGFVRAKMFLSGFSSSGIGAHEAEVAYLKKLDFSEFDVQFVNQLRYFRNGIMYYGKKFDSNYAENVFIFLRKIRKKLLK